MSCNDCSFKFFLLFGQDRNVEVFKTIVQFYMRVVLELKDHREGHPKLLRSQLETEHLYDLSLKYLVLFQLSRLDTVVCYRFF